MNQMIVVEKCCKNTTYLVPENVFLKLRWLVHIVNNGHCHLKIWTLDIRQWTFLIEEHWALLIEEHWTLLKEKYKRFGFK